MGTAAVPSTGEGRKRVLGMHSGVCACVLCIVAVVVAVVVVVVGSVPLFLEVRGMSILLSSLAFWVVPPTC